MKLIMENKYENLIALGIGTLVVATAIIGNGIETKERIKAEVKSEQEEKQIVEFKGVDRIKEDFTILTSEEVLNKIVELNVNEYSLPYASYKILEFKDSEGYYRIMPVTTKVNYDVNTEGQITGEYYDVYDALYGVPLFRTCTFEKNDLDEYNPLFKGARIISYEDFNEVGNIAYLYGADEEYINDVVPMSEDNNFVSNIDIATAYVSLIPESYRVTFLDLDKQENLTLG